MEKPKVRLDNECDQKELNEGETIQMRDLIDGQAYRGSQKKLDDLLSIQDVLFTFFHKKLLELKGLEDTVIGIKSDVEFVTPDNDDLLNHYLQLFTNLTASFMDLRDSVYNGMKGGIDSNTAINDNMMRYGTMVSELKPQVNKLRDMLMDSLADMREELITKMDDNFNQLENIIFDVDGLREALAERMTTFDAIQKALESTTEFQAKSNASKRRLACLDKFESRLEKFAANNLKQNAFYNRLCFFWQMVVRIITLACVIMGSLVSSQHLNASTSAYLGLALVICNSVTGTASEILGKVQKKLDKLKDLSITVLLAKIKLAKTYDAALDDGNVNTHEYQQILDGLTAAFKAIEEQNGSKA